MGDKKPSDYFRTLQRLAGTCGTVGEELIKKLWITRLPHSISVALIPQSDNELQDLLKLADRIWEAVKTANVSAVRFHDHSPSSIDQLKNEVSELKAQIEKLSLNRSRERARSSSKDRSFSRGQSRHRSRSSKRFNPEGKFCYYHFKFGNQAHPGKCKQPCSFVNQSQSSKTKN